MRPLRVHLRLLRQRQVVRPWALAAPILILAVALPLLRPLRHPGEISSEESLRLATISALVQHGTLNIRPHMLNPQETVTIDGHAYAQQPPILAILLAGPYWVMHRFGLTLENDASLAAYLLTLLGVTLPVALGVGLVYRMARMFELARPLRTLLALVVAFGSGILSYATVLNAHAPAGALILAAATLLIQAAVDGRASIALLWLLPAGALATLAALMEPPGWAFALLFLCVVLAIRWKFIIRLGAAMLYLMGGAAVLTLHIWLVGPALTYATTVPAPIQALHADWTQTTLPAPELQAANDDEFEPASAQHTVWRDTGRVVMALIGSHGLLTHFPAIIFGLIGISAILHRHWPASTKVLAIATLGGSIAILIGCVLWSATWRPSAFAMPWFVLFTPLILFWAGAWLRRSHRPRSWAMAGGLLLFSVLVSVIGATHPMPRHGYDGYSVIAALRDMTHMSRPLPAVDALAEAHRAGGR